MPIWHAAVISFAACVYRATAWAAITAYRNPVYPFTPSERRTYRKDSTTNYALVNVCSLHITRLNLRSTYFEFRQMFLKVISN